METPAPLLIGEQTAAEMLGLSVKTLQKWRNQQCGPPYIKLEAAVRYRVSDLERFVASGLRGAPVDDD